MSGIRPMTRYAELQVTTNFSFLEGGSHPEELATEAAGRELSPMIAYHYHRRYADAEPDRTQEDEWLTLVRESARRLEAAAHFLRRAHHIDADHNISLALQEVERHRIVHAAIHQGAPVADNGRKNRRNGGGRGKRRGDQ